MSERVYLPNGNTALFTPRYGSNRGFVRVRVGDLQYTVSGEIVGSSFRPNPEGLNALFVSKPFADTVIASIDAFPEAPSV